MSTQWECHYCGKSYPTAGGMHRHERHYCKQRPELAPGEVHGAAIPAVERDSRPDPVTAPDEDGTPSTSPVLQIRKLYDDLVFAHAHNSEDGGPSLYRLDLLTSIIEAAEQARAYEVTRARAAGASWTRVGQQIGTTKQAAQQRYGAKARPTATDPNQLTISDA